jgi:hypothetical protein
MKLTNQDLDILRELLEDKIDKIDRGPDNEVDNHNMALGVLNRIWLTMLTDFEKLNITSSENPSFALGSFEGAKLLDGAVLEFEVEVPNTTINLCQLA